MMRENPKLTACHYITDAMKLRQEHSRRTTAVPGFSIDGAGLRKNGAGLLKCPASTLKGLTLSRRDRKDLCSFGPFFVALWGFDLFR
jgi:hypothetical protein